MSPTPQGLAELTTQKLDAMLVMLRLRIDGLQADVDRGGMYMHLGGTIRERWLSGLGALAQARTDQQLLDRERRRRNPKPSPAAARGAGPAAAAECVDASAGLSNPR